MAASTKGLVLRSLLFFGFATLSFAHWSMSSYSVPDSTEWRALSSSRCTITAAKTLPSVAVWGRAVMVQVTTDIGVPMRTTHKVINLHFGAIRFAAPSEQATFKHLVALPVEGDVVNGVAKTDSSLTSLRVTECPGEVLNFMCKDTNRVTALLSELFIAISKLPRVSSPPLSLCEAAVLMETVNNAIESLPHPGHIAIVGNVEPADVVFVAHTLAAISTRSVLHVETPTNSETKALLERLLEESGLSSMVVLAPLDSSSYTWTKALGLIIARYSDVVPSSLYRLSRWLCVGGQISILGHKTQQPLLHADLYEVLSGAEEYSTLVHAGSLDVYQRVGVPSRDSGTPLKIHMALRDKSATEIARVIIDTKVQVASPSLVSQFTPHPRSVSVILPCLNCAQTLTKTLLSIDESAKFLLERLPGASVEIVFVDDGSKDTSSIVASLVPLQYSKLKVVKLPQNVGIGNALNIGVNSSSGEVISFMDADDTYYPSHFYTCITLLHQTPCFVVDAGYTQTEIQTSIPVPEEARASLSNTLLQTKCVRRPCLEAVGGFPGWRHANDLFFSVMGFTMCHGVWSPTVTAEYSCYASNLCGKQMEKFHTGIDEWYKQNTGEFDGIEYDSVVKWLQERYIAQDQDPTPTRRLSPYRISWSTYHQSMATESFARVLTGTDSEINLTEVHE